MNFIHKDSNPKETVKKIKKILAEVGIYPIISNMIESNTQIFSCRITDEKLKDVGTNGKGLTKDLALASAYAEFMERLQNGALYSLYFGNKGRKFKYRDELLWNKLEYFDKEKDVVKEFKLKNDQFTKNEGILTIPLYNLKYDKISYLPTEIFLSHSWTTGMCAGNSPEEAMCQGICEIFERKLSSEIFTEFFETPTIPQSFIKDKKNS